MNFSADRDLLAHEPTVFNDVPFLAQQHTQADDATVTGLMLTSDDADFEVAAVTTGDVVLIDDLPHEVIARVNANTLTVSLPRARTADAPIPSTIQGPGHRVRHRTFAPQAALVQGLLVELLRLNATPEGLVEDDILSMDVMARLEALGTLERLFTAAAAVTGDRDAFLDKAAHYRAAFTQAVRRARVLVDRETNPAAPADRPDVITFTRA